jgi:hypothetical protein
MSLPPKNKIITVALFTFGATSLYLAFGFYNTLWPYQSWFQTISATYNLSIFVFSALIVILNIYSLIAWILGKRRNKNLNSAVIIGPTISVTILFLYVCSPYLPKFLPNGSYSQPFNSELWIADDSLLVNEGITNRQKMLGDVVDNVLPGKTKNEIIRNLGLFSNDSGHPLIDDLNQQTLVFYLGPARRDFKGVSAEWLRIYLDPSGHFEKYEHYEW